MFSRCSTEYKYVLLYKKYQIFPKCRQPFFFIRTTGRLMPDFWKHSAGQQSKEKKKKKKKRQQHKQQQNNKAKKLQKDRHIEDNKSCKVKGSK